MGDFENENRNVLVIYIYIYIYIYVFRYFLCMFWWKRRSVLRLVLRNAQCCTKEVEVRATSFTLIITRVVLCYWQYTLFVWLFCGGAFNL